MSQAFLKAERARQDRELATAEQRRYLRALAKRVGIEPPEVSWRGQASDAITKLEQRLRQPTLEDAAAT